MKARTSGHIPCRVEAAHARVDHRVAGEALAPRLGRVRVRVRARVRARVRVGVAVGRARHRFLI